MDSTVTLDPDCMYKQGDDKVWRRLSDEEADKKLERGQAMRERNKKKRSKEYNFLERGKERGSTSEEGEGIGYTVEMLWK